MSKRKEIRDGITPREAMKLPIEERRRIMGEQADTFIRQQRIHGIAFKLYELDGGTQEYWDTSPKDRKEYLCRAKLMAEYLHSQGVVIKVDRELPEKLFYWDTDKSTISFLKPPWLDEVVERAGYVAVEPIMGESK